jgi:ribosomal-protein-alanine N-acetyltransferase
MPLYAHRVEASVTTIPPASRDEPAIRQAERADLLAVYRIEQAAFPQPWPFEAFEGYLGERGFLVAVDEGVLGYVVADSVPNHGSPLGHVKDIAVHDDYRGQGIGSQLLQRAIGVLEARGAGSIKLEVREDNEGAISLYRAFGFVHRRTIPRYYDDGEDAYVLVRDC